MKQLFIVLALTIMSSVFAQKVTINGKEIESDLVFSISDASVSPYSGIGFKTSKGSYTSYLECSSNDYMYMTYRKKELINGIRLNFDSFYKCEAVLNCALKMDKSEKIFVHASKKTNSIIEINLPKSCSKL